MNKKYEYDDVRELKERANASMTLSATLAGLVFTAAVIFVSLSTQNILSYVLSVVLFLATFIFIFGIVISHDILIRCSIENIEEQKMFATKAHGYNAIGLILLTVGICLLAFYIHSIVGVISTILLIMLIILWLKWFVLQKRKSNEPTNTKHLSINPDASDFIRGR